MADTDPYYSRKPVPNEFIENVGFTGLQNTEELGNRERKLSSTVAGDLRKFSNPKKDGKLDPFYQRKPVPDSLIRDVVPSGLSPEEEYASRERKYSVGGTDLRKFSTGRKGSYAPKDDPFYNRKPVDKSEIHGVGETGLSKAEEFEVRENKESLFDLSKDPFAMVTGSGHRASVSGPAMVAVAEDARRRSSVAPHHIAAAQHSGHQGAGLDRIESRREEDEITPSHSSGISHNNPTTTTTTTTTTATHTFPGTVNGAQNSARDNTGGLYYDSVAPDQK